MVSGRFMERYGDYLTLRNLTVRKTLNACRLRCPFCCQGHYASGVHSRRQMLSYEDFLVLLRMIAAATGAGVRCRVDSTLNVDFQPTTARDIARSGLYKLNCAIDGATHAPSTRS